MSKRKTYLIQCGKYGAIKIGSTKNSISSRLKTIQSNCPYKLNLLYVLEGKTFSEKRLHKTFNNLRIHGEWFKFSGKLKSFIKNPNSSIIKKPKRNSKSVKSISNLSRYTLIKKYKDDEKMNFSEIAEIFNLTRQRIHQIYNSKKPQK